jgi:hypothetical protein
LAGRKASVRPWTPWASPTDRATRQATAYGGTLHLVCARPRTCQLLAITGLDRQIPVARTLSEALAALPPDEGIPEGNQP